ncbi:hypothetical protein GF385_01250 [Candidatus Dependentiae bacterium]|nr:hypothetical protein [Candidatus Dependentiae bacterium]
MFRLISKIFLIILFFTISNVHFLYLQEEEATFFEDSSYQSLKDGDLQEERAAGSQQVEVSTPATDEVGAKEMEDAHKIGEVEEPKQIATETVSSEKVEPAEKEIVEQSQKQQETPVIPDKKEVVSENQEFGSQKKSENFMKKEKIEEEKVTETKEEKELRDFEKVKLEEEYALVEDSKAAQNLKNLLNKSKIIGKKINEIVDRLRNVRKNLYEKYRMEVDRALDGLLQEMGFESGELTGKDRFKLLNKTVKKEFEREWEIIKEKVNKIDSLEDQILNKLTELDDEYDKAVKFSIESRKLNLEIFNTSDLNKIEEVLNKIKIKLKDVREIEQKILKQKTEKINLLINKVRESFKEVEQDLKELETKKEDLRIYQETLERAKKARFNRMPKWRRVIMKSFDKTLDYTSMFFKKTKDFFIQTYSKAANFFQKFIGDVKDKSKEIQEDNEEIELEVDFEKETIAKETAISK